MPNNLKIRWRWHDNGHATFMIFFVDYYALPVAHMYFTGGGPYRYELFMNVKGQTDQTSIHLNTEEEAIAWLHNELKGMLLVFAPRRIHWREFCDDLWSRDKTEWCFA